MHWTEDSRISARIFVSNWSNAKLWPNKSNILYSRKFLGRITFNWPLDLSVIALDFYCLGKQFECAAKVTHELQNRKSYTFFTVSGENCAIQHLILKIGRRLDISLVANVWQMLPFLVFHSLFFDIASRQIERAFYVAHHSNKINNIKITESVSVWTE